MYSRPRRSREYIVIMNVTATIPKMVTAISVRRASEGRRGVLARSYVPVRILQVRFDTTSETSRFLALT
jgi:hypothetical protein